MNIIEQLNWRYATKVFDKTKKISNEDFAELLESFRLTASSLGFQHYELLVIENPEIRQALLPFTWNQKQTIDASHYLVFCCKNKLTENDIVNHVKYISLVRNQPIEKVLPYGERIRNFLKGMTEKDVFEWLSNQVFIALGNLMTVCAIKNIDTCAIGGFEPEKYINVLGLNELELTPVVCLAVGYRSAEDTYQHVNKVRKPMEKIVRIV